MIFDFFFVVLHLKLFHRKWMIMFSPFVYTRIKFRFQYNKLNWNRQHFWYASHFYLGFNETTKSHFVCCRSVGGLQWNRLVGKIHNLNCQMPDQYHQRIYYLYIWNWKRIRRKQTNATWSYLKHLFCRWSFIRTLSFFSLKLLHCSSTIVLNTDIAYSAKEHSKMKEKKNKSKNKRNKTYNWKIITAFGAKSRTSHIFT